MPQDAQLAGDGAATIGDNSKSRYEIIKEKFARLEEIKAEQKALREEANEIIGGLADGFSVNKGALAEIRRLGGLDAAAIEDRERSRTELYHLLIQPKIDGATAGEGRE